MMKPSEHPVLFTVLIGGAIGILIPLVFFILFYLSDHGFPFHFSYSLLLILCPAAMIGLALGGNPSFGDNLIVAIFIFGGNALLYAFVASFPVSVYFKIKEFLDPNIDRPLSIRPK
jgi:hypothetical protein